MYILVKLKHFLELNNHNCGQISVCSLKVQLTKTQTQTDLMQINDVFSDSGCAKACGLRNRLS